MIGGRSADMFPTSEADGPCPMEPSITSRPAAEHDLQSRERLACDLDHSDCSAWLFLQVTVWSPTVLHRFDVSM